jgi:hypothetical protein
MVGRITASGVFKCAYGELPELEVVAARRGFDAYDVDGDGIVSRLDFHRAMTQWEDKLGARTSAELDEMYASLDIYDTGKVDFLTFAEMRVCNHEFQAALKRIPGSMMVSMEVTRTQTADQAGKLKEPAVPPVATPPMHFWTKIFGGVIKCCAVSKLPK